jgi:hypothetical protein
MAGDCNRPLSLLLGMNVVVIKMIMMMLIMIFNSSSKEDK